MPKGVKGFAKGNKVGENTRFTPLKQPKHNGRKPLLTTRILRQYCPEMSEEDICKTIWLLLNLTIPKCEAFLQRATTPNSEIPIWCVAVVKAMLYETYHGQFRVCMRLLDRATKYAPKETRINQVNINLTPLTTTERAALKKLLDMVGE